MKLLIKNKIRRIGGEGVIFLIAIAGDDPLKLVEITKTF